MPSLIEDYVQLLLSVVADSPYDDTPHHPEITGFPYHKHIQQETNVQASEPPTLAGVLTEIEHIFPLNK